MLLGLVKLFYFTNNGGLKLKLRMQNQYLLFLLAVGPMYNGPIMPLSGEISGLTEQLVQMLVASCGP